MKKNFGYILLFTVIGSLSGCVESTTEATIQKNGSGTVVTYVDMAKLFDVTRLMGQNPAEGMGADRVIDSVIYFKDNIKRVEEHKGAPMTADEKEVYENSRMHMKLDMKKSILNFTITSKFSKITQLPIATELIKEAFKQGILNKRNEDEPGADMEIDNMIDNEKDGISFNVRDGVIENSYDSTKLSRSEEVEKMMQRFDIFKIMLGDMPIKVIYNLPRRSKSVSGKAKTEVSKDKKKVTISYDLLDVIKDPSLQTYRIEY